MTINLVQLDTSDTEGECDTNESDLDSKGKKEGWKEGEEKDEDNKSNPETEEPGTKKAISPKIKIK